ncbi:MAG: CehA/McbA family metallohydrolase [Defluviitaleaceae bacterium]|nr:CehA/McbA family metallohydrolase [Defluviitaleaceae bacterium]
MKKNLFLGNKNAYKANLHCHTTVSDGRRTPEEIKAMYTAKGYSIVAFTDHNTLKPQSRLNDDSFLAINACEVNINQTLPASAIPGTTKTYHFNLYAIRPDMVHTPALPEMDYSDINAINKYIADRNQEGFLVNYNHPYWSMQTYIDYYKLKGCFAMEIYNHNCETEGYYGYHPQAYDEMLRVGQRIYCLAVDDNHNSEPENTPEFDSFGGYIQVNSNSLKYEDVMNALAKGDFYSSQGPEIYEISIDGDELTIECSPVENITVYTIGRRCYIKTGTGLTGAKFKLNGTEGYIRVMCRDNKKRDANSNAFWL